jgi:hypothetical protein
MKNIHILPTDKPSRFWITNLGNLARCQDVEPIKKALGNNVNIYITSDEEIKEGDWVYCITENRLLISNVSYSKLEDRFKIILTTDPNLIKDGIQSIDDTFLKWFVKNPSCDKVEVELHIGSLRWSDSKNRYKIIIPQEEPKK